MGTYVCYDHLYDNIKKTNPAMTDAELKAEMERFITGSLISPLSQDQILDLISEHPLRGLEHPRPMPRFTPEQRQQRREKSAALRSVMLDDIIKESKLLKGVRGGEGQNLQVFDRQNQRLFRTVNPTDSPEQQEQTRKFNEEVAKLFDSNPRNAERNNAELRQELINQNPGITEKEANQMISRRRAQIVMNYLRSQGDAVEHLEEMTDTNLPTETLVNNFKQILEINHIFAEMENFMKAVPALYTLSDEDLRWVQSQRRYLNESTVALEKMRMIANPAFEFIDIDCLEDYALDDFREAEAVDGGVNENSYEYQARESDEAAAFINNLKQQNPNYAAYTASGVFDNVTEFLGDMAFMLGNSDIINFERTARDFGFTAGNYKFEGRKVINGNRGRWTSADVVSFAKDGDPVAATQNGRVVVFRYVGNRFQQETPESIYNYDLASSKHRLSQMMKKADPWYHSSSPVFKSMRKAFENAKKLGEIKKGESLSDSFQRYRDLLKATEDYLKTKPEDSNKKWEKRHINMGKALKTFAEEKLRQLELLQQARDTQKLLANKTPEEIRSFAAQHDKVAQDAKALQEQRIDREAHRSNPAAWVENRLDKRYVKNAIPEEMRTLMQFNINNFKTLMEDNRIYDGNQEFAQTAVAELAGNMIAAELILREKQWLKADVPGPLETIYGGLEHVNFAKLGEKAMVAATGKELARNNPGEDGPEAGAAARMTGEDLKNFVETFDPKALMEKLSDDIYKENNLSPIEQQLNGQFINSIKPMRSISFDQYERAFDNFARSRIIEPLKDLEGGNEKLSSEAARMFATNCVIYSMIQLERASGGEKGPGAYEKLLTGDGNDAEALRNQIDANGKFNEMMSRCTDVNGNLSLGNAMKLLDQRAPQKLALGLMKGIAQEHQNRQQQQQQQPQRQQQPQQPQNAL